MINPKELKFGIMLKDRYYKTLSIPFTLDMLSFDEDELVLDYRKMNKQVKLFIESKLPSLIGKPYKPVLSSRTIFNK